jgi:hypothetical protein
MEQPSAFRHVVETTHELGRDLIGIEIRYRRLNGWAAVWWSLVSKGLYQWGLCIDRQNSPSRPGPPGLMTVVR